MKQSHYAKAMDWTERKLAGVPVIRRNKKALRLVALAAVGLIVVNEVRGVVLLVVAGPPAVMASIKYSRQATEAAIAAVQRKSAPE